MRERAFSPRTVTLVEMRSLRLMPKVRTVYLAFPKMGCWPVSCSNTCAGVALCLLIQLWGTSFPSPLLERCQQTLLFPAP